MSELLPGVFMLDGVSSPGRPGTVNPCLIVSGGEATMVDAGFAGITGPLTAALAEAGLRPDDVKRIVITHYHSDHIGGLAEAVALTGAEVWVHEADAAIVDGSEKAPAASRAFMAAMAAARRQPRPQPTAVPVARRLHGGEVIDALGGLRVLHTPGHTRGHLALYAPEASLLLAGDMLRYEDGRVVRPPAMFGWDLGRAEESIAEVAALEFEAMLPYHGDFLARDACRRVRADLGL